MKLITFLLAFGAMSINALGQTTDKGRQYHSDEINWTVDIPDNWTIIPKNKQEEMDKKGKDAMQKSYGAEFDTKQLKNLLSFQKDRFNVFGSTIEPTTSNEAEYENSNRQLYNIIYKTYADHGAKLDTSSGTAMRQEMKFNTFTTVLYGPDGKVLLRQTLYSRIYKGYDFGVTISYNNERDREIMINAFKNSKFK